MKTKIAKIKWLALVIIALAAIVNYQDMFTYTAYLFNHPLEDMSHGWIVPLVSIYVIWRERLKLRSAAGPASWKGAVCVAFFLAVAWFGGRGEQTRIAQISFIGLLWAIPYAFWGRGTEKLMRFPVAYLIFTIPLSSLTDFITVRLRLFSVMLATGILNGVGLAVERSGTALFSYAPNRSFSVDVAEPCSGIRSLFAMMALTAAYAYFTQKGRWKKLLLFACSVPIAVAGNIVRIMSICVVASWFGQDVATGYYHEYSGFVFFAFGIFLMFYIGDKIKNINIPLLDRERTKVEGKQDNTAAAKADGRYDGIIVACVTALALAVFTAGYLMPAPTYDTVSFVAESLPEKVGEFTSDVPWFCQDPQCLTTAAQQGLTRVSKDGSDGFACPACGKLMSVKSLGENSILPQDTVILKRNYRSSDEVEYAVNVVIQGRTRAGIHRAEVCLPSQGFNLEKARRIPLRLAGYERPLSVRRIDASRPAVGTRMPVRQNGKLTWYDKPDGAGNADGYIDGFTMIYWMESRERVSCSHVQRILTDVWDRSVHNRINRWVMIALSVSSGLQSEEDIERLESFLSDFVPRVLLKQ